MPHHPPAPREASHATRRCHGRTAPPNPTIGPVETWTEGNVFFILADVTVLSLPIAQSGELGGHCESLEAAGRRVPRGRVPCVGDPGNGDCRRCAHRVWLGAGRGCPACASSFSSSPGRCRVCPGSGQRIDRARRRHRPGVEREQCRRRHLSGLADQDDDVVPDLRGAEYRAAAARSAAPGQPRGGEQAADEARLAAG